MIKRSYKYYNNGKITKRFYEDEEIPEGWKPGVLSKFGKPSWNKGLDVTDPRVKRNADNIRKSRIQNGTYVSWKKGLTKETDSRVKGFPGKLNPMYGKHPIAWNKGLTKETNSIVKQMSEHQKGKTAWNKGLLACNDNRIQKGVNTRKANGTLNTSKPEENFYNFLCSYFGAEDVIRQYKSDKYPFNCDFYIKSKDLYIELNLFWTHGFKPFNELDDECIKQLQEWKYKSEINDFYKSAINTWTVRDVNKSQIAKENNLNYLTIYNKEQLKEFIKNCK